MRRAVVVLSVIGIGIAGYLTWIHYDHLKVVCFSGGGGCEKVQGSDYAELAGVPVAVLGLLGYVGILAALVRDNEATRTAAAFLAIGGLAFSGWLTYAEIFKIHAICIWCVGSAICMTLLAILSAVRMVSDPVSVHTSKVPSAMT